MTVHLLALSIGPVQDFIAAARRTRDLWFGSHLLSEISKAAAKAVKAGGGDLILPTAQDAETDAAVANVILAELCDGVVPQTLCEEAKEASKNRWLEFAAEAHQAAGSAIREDLWQEQLGDAIEFYAAWVPVNGNYGHARRRVMRLLAGRKACRDFSPAKGHAGIPKSSLDGRREAVLQKGITGSKSLRLAKGEQLCAVGLTKRLAGGHRPYPSVARVAADAWLRGVASAAERDPKVAAAFERLKHECALKAIHRLDAIRFPQFQVFLFEGTSVYLSRFDDWRQEAGLSDDDLNPLRDELRALKSLGLGEPDPYVAVLVADGDHVGMAISELRSAGEHRDFSGALARFAAAARRIIEGKNGVCVYAGGDDVLAFLPADKALGCARALHGEFSDRLSAFRDQEGRSPTLSVGIAIGHFMEPLEDLREYGREAEKAAKNVTSDAGRNDPFGERNGLAVRVHPRGGVELGVREQWQDGEDSLDRRLDQWAELFARRTLPNKLPYDLREQARVYDTWPDSATLAVALRADLKLLLKRKQVNLDKADGGEDLAWVKDRIEKVGGAPGLRRLASELLAAQWFEAAQHQAASHGAGERREDSQ